VVDNKSMYNLNSDIHNINTSQNSTSTNIHQIYLYIKKGVHSFGIKVFNNLPQSLKILTGNSKQFKKHWNITYILTPSTP
jgi:hypothetical protein